MTGADSTVHPELPAAAIIGSVRRTVLWGSPLLCIDRSTRGRTPTLLLRPVGWVCCGNMWQADHRSCQHRKWSLVIGPGLSAPLWREWEQIHKQHCTELRHTSIQPTNPVAAREIPRFGSSSSLVRKAATTDTSRHRTPDVSQCETSSYSETQRDIYIVKH